METTRDMLISDVKSKIRISGKEMEGMPMSVLNCEKVGLLQDKAAVLLGDYSGFYSIHLGFMFTIPFLKKYIEVFLLG